MKWKRQPSGFTLVEILIVVAVIAVLCALLLPIFANARKSARETACASQLHQIGIAFQMYRDDHHDRPLRLDVLWPRYIPTKKLFICPDDAWIAKGGWAWSSWGRYSTPPEKWPFPVSYGYFFSSMHSDPYWEKAQTVSGRPGYVVCVLHGTPLDSLEGDEAPAFTGRILRLCFDGSVITRQIPSSGLHTWTLMTDQKKNPDF